MTGEIFYRQCDLRRVNGQRDTAWIPEEYAQKGKYLRIGKENGWRVVAVYARAPASILLHRERDYLIQRKASDV